jgi:hypothetical protein
LNAHRLLMSPARVRQPGPSSTARNTNMGIPRRSRLLVAATLGLGLAALAAVAPRPARAIDPPAPTGRFTGVLVLRQQDGTLYYKVFVVRSRVIGGFQRWQGVDEPHHDIVGGWYRGNRLALLLQSAQDDVDDRWFSHVHQFEREADQFVVRHTLSGFGHGFSPDDVYTPHVVDEHKALSEEEVRRLMAEARTPKPAKSQPDQSQAPGDAADAKAEDPSAGQGDSSP